MGILVCLWGYTIFDLWSVGYDTSQTMAIGDGFALFPHIHSSHIGAASSFVRGKFLRTLSQGRGVELDGKVFLCGFMFGNRDFYTSQISTSIRKPTFWWKIVIGVVF